MATAFVGIGSNLGEPEAQIAAALEQLAAEEGIELVAVSSLRETEPVGYLD
jgi:2-amino-4-hydroxy-6-hydroxymethyldihydropteridine diphosphokinase